MLANLRRSTVGAARLYSSLIPEDILLRDFIHDSLYHPSEGYFQKLQAPVGSLAAPIPFSGMLGKTDYLRAVKAAYDALQVSWLTPSEIFTPHYGRAVAAYILQQHANAKSAGTKQPLQVFELGAGTGRLAQDILDYIKQADPRTYESCSYTVREISPTLASIQEQRVAEEGRHGRHFNVAVRDGSDRAAWGSRQLEPCFILLMEVLDNCAHDRVCRNSNGQWRQTMVSQDEGGQPGEAGLQELLEPVTDPWIQRCLTSLNNFVPEHKSAWDRLLDFASGSAPQKKDDVVFLPTKALMLMETLCDARPNHNLIAADFNELPETTIAGRNAPLVSRTVGGKSQDYNTYLLPRGTADIFFPSDFQMLRQLYMSAARASGTGASAEVQTTAHFMQTYADVGATRTLSGFDPLQEDYTNTSFFLGQSRLA